jgi:hypothetical protein
MVFISIDHTEAVPFIWKPRGSDNLTSYSERTTMNVLSKPSQAMQMQMRSPCLVNRECNVAKPSTSPAISYLCPCQLAIHAIPSPYHSIPFYHLTDAKNSVMLYNQSPSITLNFFIFSIPIAISTPLVIQEIRLGDLRLGRSEIIDSDFYDFTHPLDNLSLFPLPLGISN